MEYNAKAVYLTIADQEIQIVVFNKFYNLFLECLLKKIFRTVRVVDMDWPNADTLYHEGYEDGYKAGLHDANITTTAGQVVSIKSVWYKAISKDCTVLAAKADIDGSLHTVIHNQTFAPAKARKVCDMIRQAGSINLTHWR